MLVGYPPFYDENPFGIYEKILSGKIEWPRHIDPSAKDLVKKLLTNDRTKRLGNMKVSIIDNRTSLLRFFTPLKIIPIERKNVVVFFNEDFIDNLRKATTLHD